MNETLFYLILIVGVLVVMLSIAALLIWYERRMLALWQDRYGPNRVGPFGLVQVLADMVKIFLRKIGLRRLPISGSSLSRPRLWSLPY